MTDTMTTQAAQELLQAAQADLEAARRRLGEAIASGNQSASSEARVDIAAIEQRITDLQAALPVAEEREAEQKAAEQAEAERAHQAAQNELRDAHLTACRKVDKALQALGAAYDELKATDRNVGGDRTDTNLCLRRRDMALKAAFFAANSQLALDLGFRRSRDIQGLAESEAQLIKEFGK